MIKLNLLPEPDPAITIRRAIFVMTALMSVCLILGLVVYSTYLNRRLTYIRNEITSMERMVSTLREKNKEGREIEETVAYLSKLAEDISKIKLNQIGVSQLLTEISKKIPDKVWLLSLDKEDDVVKLEGFAMSDFDLANFQRGLETIPWIKKVELIQSITVYLTKVFAYDSLSKDLLMQVVENKNQGKFVSFIQNQARIKGLKTFNTPPPAGALETDKIEGQTTIGWVKTGTQINPGVYIWTRGDTLEAKHFLLELFLAFERMVRENEN
ncbi:MAG: PilN domain-containing protein [Deltaproteobacteria bacterium]|nr:PilN domain-containing protein [Deltaproteobacteria bacterium]MCX7952836.1 PilN domain-containing protein [Deltaproteobacteria bacterium]